MNSPHSEWLLVSDIDGTLNNKQLKLPENNKKAVSKFVSDGGNFTLCSGRNLKSLESHYIKLGIKTPAIFSNGAGIYDFSTEKMIFLDTISSQGEELLYDLYSSIFPIQMTVYGVDTIYMTSLCNFHGFGVAVKEKLDYKLCPNREDLPKGEWTKVAFCGLPDKVKEIKGVLESDKYSSVFDCFLTSPFTLDVVNSGVNKGTAVKRLAEYLGINPQNVGAIGDYYNDRKMLESVAHPVCCGQAPDEIKSICEYVTCHCNDGAVCDFINYIEKNYIL